VATEGTTNLETSLHVITFINDIISLFLDFFSSSTTCMLCVCVCGRELPFKVAISHQIVRLAKSTKSQKAESSNVASQPHKKRNKQNKHNAA
jgi:hypothetical protein